MSPTGYVRSGGAWVQSGLAGKVRFGGADIAFAPPDEPVEGVSLFTDQTPFNADSSDGTVLHLGTFITFAVAGNITKLRWYAPATPPSAPPKYAIFDPVTSTKLTTPEDLSFGAITPGAWNEVTLPAPLAVAAGVERGIVIRTPDRYTASAGAASPLPLTNGPLFADAGDGRYSTSNPDEYVQLPDSVFNNGCYFVDVVFVPS